MINALQDAGDAGASCCDWGLTPLTHTANMLGAGRSFETFQVVHVCVFIVEGCQASDLFLRGFGPRVIPAPANRA